MDATLSLQPAEGVHEILPHKARHGRHNATACSRDARTSVSVPTRFVVSIIPLEASAPTSSQRLVAAFVWRLSHAMLLLVAVVLFVPVGAGDGGELPGSRDRLTPTVHGAPLPLARGGATVAPPGRVGETDRPYSIRPFVTQAQLPVEVQRLLALLPPEYRLVRVNEAGERILEAFAQSDAGITPLARAEPRVIQPPEYSFRDFCLDRYLPAKRPFGRTMSPGTFEHTERMLVQLESEGVSVHPPDWQQFLAWIRAHPKTAAACENQRRALVWQSAYYGVPVPDEPWARKRLDNKRDVEVARREGKLRARTRFFRLPSDLLRLVAADAKAHVHALNAATHRVIVYTSVYAGPRGTEPFQWRLGDYDPQLGTLKSWQPKKQARREVQPPEDYAFGSMLDPSLSWYLQHVRPKIDAEGKFQAPDDPVLLFWDERQGAARPWETERAYSQFVERGISAILGANAPGPHAFRRACATLRVRYGWTAEQVAAFLDDTDKVVRDSYVDWAWINRVGIMRPPEATQRPKVPRLRPDQTFEAPKPLLGKNHPRLGPRTKKQDKGTKT